MGFWWLAGPLYLCIYTPIYYYLAIVNFFVMIVVTPITCHNFFGLIIGSMHASWRNFTSFSDINAFIDCPPYLQFPKVRRKKRVLYICDFVFLLF